MAELRGYSDPQETIAGESSARRVLTLSASMGGGHDATAAGLEEAVRALWAGSEIRRLDTLDDLLGPGIGRLFRGIYVANVETTPWLYEFFYSSLWRHQWFARASKAFTGGWCAVRLARHIDKFDPDLILSTYPLATSGLAWLRRHRGLSIPCGAWVSDFAPHPFWIYRDIDANFVMHEVSVPHGQAAEPGAVVEACSPPVIGAFVPGDRNEARAKVGLQSDAFVVLVTCGAYAFGDVEAIVRTLLEAAPDVQVVAACGRNTASRIRLENLGMPAGRLLALGWTDSMADYVRAADLVLSNAGGASALEALACARPILMCRPIAAHGAANAQLMVVSGLADICANEERLRDYIRTGVADREAFEDLERKAGERGKVRDLPSVLTRLAAPRPDPARPGQPWPMRAADEFFTHVESDDVRQEIGAVLSLDAVGPDRALDVRTLRQALAGPARGLPSLRRRLERSPRAGWTLQEELNIDEHVFEAVVAPSATETEIAVVVDGFWSRPLPADRPPWQMLLVRGRANGTAVLAVKMHHALGDGVSALGLLDRLLTAAPEDRLRERTGAISSSPPRTPARVLRDAGLLARGLWSLASRGGPPHAVLNRDGIAGPGRQFVAVPLPAAQLRTAARSLHAQPHELVLSIITDGLGRVLGPAGLLRTGRLQERPQDELQSKGMPHNGPRDNAATLRVMVPVAMRAPRLDRVFGNWTGAAALDLPVGPMTPAQRVSLVQTELRRSTRHGEAEAAQLVMQLAGRLPAAVHARFARLAYTRRFFNSIVTYMPGARGPRWCAGARVRAMYPVLPLTDGVPLTVGAVLAGDTIGVGVYFDPALGLDRTAVTASVADAFESAMQAAAAGVSESASGVAAPGYRSG